MKHRVREGTPLVAHVVAVVVLLAAIGTGIGVRALGSPASDAPATPQGATSVVGRTTVSVQAVPYAPGEGRMWEAHEGLHAVTVLSGTLTVYDRWCQPHSYGPGQSYAAGWDPYLSANETASPVRTEVSYMPASASRSPLVVPPPTAKRCPEV